MSSRTRRDASGSTWRPASTSWATSPPPTGRPACRPPARSTGSRWTATCKSHGASPAWRDWFYAQHGRFARLNAAVAFALQSLPSSGRVTTIKGGNDRLPYAMADALGQRIAYGAEVVRIVQDSDGVTIGYHDRQGQHEVRADRCVCALPFAPLRRVQLDAGFAEPKMAAIERLRYMPAARCYFQTRDRFWERDPLGRLGGLDLVATDTMAGRVWNTSSQQSHPSAGMLHAYMIDTEALEFASHGSRRVEAMQRLFGSLLARLRRAGHRHRAQGVARGPLGRRRLGLDAARRPALDAAGDAPSGAAGALRR